MANEVKENPTTPQQPNSGEGLDLNQPQAEGRDFLERNQKSILLLVGVLVAIAAAIFLYRKFIQEPKQAEASELMWKAQQMFERDSFQLALTSPAPNYLGFLDIADDYSGTPAGNLANYYAGISYLRLNQYQAAIDYLKDFDEDGTTLPITKYGAIGDAHAQLGDLDKAKSNYEKAVSLAGKNELLAPYYLKKLGMLNQKQGDKQAAHSLYIKVQEEFPNSNEAQDIIKYIMATEG